MKRIALALLALAPSLAYSAGTVQQSLSQLGTTSSWVLAFRWTGDALTGIVPTVNAQGIGPINGYVVTQVETIPGIPAPTAGYSVALNDAAGIDMLAGTASALSASTPQSFATSAAAPPVQGAFSLSVSGQTTPGGKGVVYVFLQPAAATTVIKQGSLAASIVNMNAIGVLVQPSGSGHVDFQSAIGPAPLMQWHFNDTAQGVANFSEYGSNGVTLAPTQLGDYHIVYQGVGADGTTTFKAFAVEAHQNAGTGNALVALFGTCLSDGTWSAGSGAVGLATKGCIGGAFSGSSGLGGYPTGALILGSCFTTACSSVSGAEIDVTNGVNGTSSHAGVLVVELGGGGTYSGAAATNYGYGLTATSPAVGFNYGFLIQSSGAFPVIPTGTLIASLTGNVAIGLDFSAVTFSSYVLNLPGFVLAPGGSLQGSPITMMGNAGATDLTITGNKTGSNGMLFLTQGVSTWNGNALDMNFGTGGGTFSGNFEAYFVNGVAKWEIDSTGAPISPVLASISGQRYVCVDTNGKLHSSASACSGT